MNPVAPALRVDADHPHRAVGADADVLRRYYEEPRNTTSVDGLVDGFVRLNMDLTEQLDRHHAIGHSFFMDREHDAEHLRRTWRREILPLIEDYFYDQPEVVRQFTPEKFWPSVA